MKKIFKKHYPRLQKFEKFFFNNVFVYLLVIVYFFGIMEFAVYPGFVKNNFFVGYQAFIYASIILLVYFLFQKRADVPSLLKNVFYVVYLTFIPLVFTYTIFYNLELSNYDNYVFATHGVNFMALQDIIALSLAIIILRFVQSKQKSLGKLFRNLSIIQMLFIASIIYLVSLNAITASKRVFYGMQNSLTYTGLSYTEALTKSLGSNEGMGWVVTYASFINEHTSDSAHIVIPPQSDSWQMTGNAGYMNYFLYPRIMSHGTTEEFKIPADATHILISHGLWGVGNIVGWPRMNISENKIEKITLIDRNTLEVTELRDSAYTFDPENYSQQWGIITLKKVE